MRKLSLKRLPVTLVMMFTVTMGVPVVTGSASGTDIDGLEGKSIVTVPQDMKDPRAEDTLGRTNK